MPFGIREYWSYRDQLSIEDGVVLKGQQIIVPQKLRKEYLKKLHEGHQGITRTQQRAKSCVYWPGIYKDIECLITGCSECQLYQPSQSKETLDPIIPDVPNIAWHTIGTDFVQHHGHDYLVIADYYSKYLIVEKMSAKTDSDAAVKFTRKIIGMFGVPNTIISDNGGQFIGNAYLRMVREYGINHVTSSPRYSKSHGFIESQVKIAEKLLKKSEDIDNALLSQRTTPLGPKLPSPAELMFNRKMQGNLPIHSKFTGNEEWIQTQSEKQERSTNYYNHNAKDLQELKLNQPIFYQDVAKRQWTPGVIIGYGPEPRSYSIECDISGRRLRRNRTMIRSRKVTFDTTKPDGTSSLEPSSRGMSSHERVNAKNQTEELKNMETTQERPMDIEKENGSNRRTDTNNANPTAVPRTSARISIKPTWMKDFVPK